VSNLKQDYSRSNLGPPQAANDNQATLPNKKYGYTAWEEENETTPHNENDLDDYEYLQSQSDRIFPDA
jgi:hypothetical protein